ncbi:peptidoglycan editing factor PgeF [Qipengyuania pelagi]|uniref:peptidoglycan editing factor PgeF n=1 Tax=Qipengyuania pelagi TaxID=994320 RepID=UPI001F2020C8|nr:peptidoglycan editing factor PgeF [Qipengyuania pelagi]
MAKLLTSDLLKGIPHGFSTREGGTAADLLPDAPLILAKQVHSPDVAVVEAPWDGDPPEADGLVAAKSGLVLGIVTADCAPVLLADMQAGVIGAAHAGWRGAQSGVIANTVAAMVDLGAEPSRIVAAVGPCVAQSSYEVDAPFRAHFDPEDARFFETGREGHWQFDLSGYVAERLRKAGVERVELLGRDTYGDAETFFSFRRATHRGEPTGGRQISLIARA